MPNLPISQVSARSQLQGAPMLNNTAGPDAFGANVGRAQEQFGQAIGQAGQVVGKIAEEEITRKRNEDVANKVASTDWLSKELALRNEVDADATDYHKTAIDRYRQTIDEVADTIDDDKTRMAYRQQMLSQLPNISARSAAYEFTVKSERSKDQANEGLGALQNKIMQDPSGYDLYKSQGMDIIANRPNMNATVKEGMVRQWGYDSAKRRFEGLLVNAKTPTDFDMVEAELRGKGDRDWQTEMLPRDYEDSLNKVQVAKRAYQTQQNANTKAAVKVLEDRDTDPMNPIPSEEVAKVGAMAASATDPETKIRYARVARNQDIIKSERKLTPAQLRDVMQRTKNNDTLTPVDPATATVINATANAYDVNASYLQATRGKESGGKADAKNPNSTATGSGQFIESTWLDLVKDPVVASALGVTKDMTREQILELRKDDAKSITATAILAKKNRAFMEPLLGRPITDVELYGAHFLGAPEAVRFVKMMEANPDTIAADVFPKAAESNKNVFQNKDGRKYTLAEVYQGFSRPFVASVASAAYDDNVVRQKMLEKMETALNGPDALEYAAAVGVVSLTPLDQEGGFSARAQAVQTASEYYGRVIQPFTSDEVAYANKIIEEGKVDDVLNLMANVQTMGTKTARAAFAQIKVKNPAFAHAGQLALDGEPTIAADIVRGSKRMKENPAILTGLEYRPEQATVDFEGVIGPALSRIPPADRQGVQEGALAYLVETQGAAGKKYSKDTYKTSVKTVLGNRIDTFNGDKTFLPKGVSSRDLTRVFSMMTTQDYVSMSPSGDAPLHADGSVAEPDELEDEARLRFIGEDKYLVSDSSGAFLWTGKTTPDGYPEKYVIELKPERLRQILARKLIAQR